MVAGLSSAIQEMNTVSKYWEYLNKKSIELIDNYGYNNFKQTVARVYNDDEVPESNFEFTRMLWDKLYATLPIEFLEKFSEPEVGNPGIILRDGQLVSIDLGISIRDYWAISKHIDFSTIDSIVELGGGYGRMPYVITQLHPNIEYTMCDIEPSLGLAKWYLSKVIPDSLMYYTSPELLRNRADLVIASNCLHEMSRQQVHKYFDYVDQNATYFYYNCWKDTTMPYDYIRWEQGDYPVKNHWVKLFERDYIRRDYFEALYKMGGECQE